MKKIHLHIDKNLVCSEGHLCTNFFERSRGLLLREPLKGHLGEALVIPKCNSIHMFGMSYPLAVIFLSKTKVVMSIERHVKPWWFAGKRGAYFAVECAVDAFWLPQLSVGQTLDWTAVVLDSDAVD